jgi:hypothetical protein
MNEKPQFDGATVEQLRQHFLVWGACQDFGGLTWPESHMFLIIDKDILDNIRPQNVELDFPASE